MLIKAAAGGCSRFQYSYSCAGSVNEKWKTGETRRLLQAASGDTEGFVFQDQSAHFFNAVQMTGSNRIIRRSGGRRSRAQELHVTPEKAAWGSCDERGQYQQVSAWWLRGLGAGLTLWGLLRASNGQQVVTPDNKEANHLPHTQKSASPSNQQQKKKGLRDPLVCSFLGNFFKAGYLLDQQWSTEDLFNFNVWILVSWKEAVNVAFKCFYF